MRSRVIPERWIIAMFAGLIGGIAAADTHYVDLNNPVPVPPYTNGWSSAANTITAATAHAETVASDTVMVNTGVYVLGKTITIAKGITLIANSTNRSDVVIDGTSTYGCISLSGAGTGRVDGFTIRNGYGTSGLAAGIRCYPNTGEGVSYTIANCTIISNYSTGSGAGIYMYTNTLLTNCTIQANSGKSGGGGVICDGGAIIRNCLIIGNSTSGGRGAGVYFYVSAGVGAAVMTDSIISNNHNVDSYGGGVYVTGGLVSNCTIVDNVSGQYGGGGVCMAGYGLVKDCTIARNNSTNASSGYGGGVYFEGSGSVENCIIKDNTARSMGGGVRLYRQSCIIRNCLIVNNSSTGRGGGVDFSYAPGGLNLFQNCTIVSNVSSGSNGGGMYLLAYTGVTNIIENTIIYYNNAVNYSNWYAGGNYSFTNSCMAPTDNNNGSGNLDANPLFADRDSTNYHLAARSQCINAGVYREWMMNAVDLDGRPRINRRDGGGVDIGAYENITSGTFFMGR
ncbi:MAG: choice-of-anchor Q domain-containing protein [Kiritimatiellae bacterium]|nr:choice-of-anchor Q domain-containing protein [Kiritimatiellia bacterium]